MEIARQVALVRQWHADHEIDVSQVIRRVRTIELEGMAS